MIRLENVQKSFDGLLIFTNVNLEIEKGDAVVIIGGSGCGKSTFLRCINRLTTPDHGRILIDGVDILDPKTKIDEVRKKMGMVYQQFNLFSHLNVLENVILAPMKVLGLSREEAIAEARGYLEKVGMLDHQYFMPGELSGGQKQRAAIARTLAMHPEVILFDEPTSALDPTMVDEVESVIRDLVRSGMTSIIVTHEMRFAKNIASKVVFLAEHGIYETGSAKDIFENPQKPLTRQFLYRSRMLERVIDGTSDVPSILSEYRTFLTNFDYNHRQQGLFNVIMDELIYPVLNSRESGCQKVQLRLICSETTTAHTVFVTFYGMKDDPLGEKYMDELNQKLLNARFAVCHSQLDNEGNPVVVLQME